MVHRARYVPQRIANPYFYPHITQNSRPDLVSPILFSSLESASEESSTKEMIYAFSGQVTLDEIY